MYKKRSAIAYTLEQCQDLLEDWIDPQEELIRMADLIDWSFIETVYARKFKKKGKTAVCARVAFGLLFLKHQTRLSSAKVLQEMLGRPAWQYFLGYPVLQSAQPVTPSALGRFSSRFTSEDLAAIVEHQILFPQSPDRKAKALPSKGKAPLFWRATPLPKPKQAKYMTSVVQEVQKLRQKEDNASTRQDWFLLFGAVVQKQANDPVLLPDRPAQKHPAQSNTRSSPPAGASDEQPPVLTSLKGDVYLQPSLW